MYTVIYHDLMTNEIVETQFKYWYQAQDFIDRIGFRYIRLIRPNDMTDTVTGNGRY